MSFFSLRSICDNGDTSEALSGHFRTLPPQDTVVVCLPVHNVVVSFNNPDDPYQATVCWNGSADAYEVAVTNNDDASSYSATVNGASCHTFNLDNIGATWSAIVRAICNDTLYSEWSDPVLFDTPPFVNPIGIDNSQLTTASTRFVVHPNPSNGTATVTLSAIEGPVAITVVDLMGRTVTSVFFALAVQVLPYSLKSPRATTVSKPMRRRRCSMHAWHSAASSPVQILLS